MTSSNKKTTKIKKKVKKEDPKPISPVGGGQGGFLINGFGVGMNNGR